LKTGIQQAFIVVYPKQNISTAEIKSRSLINGQDRNNDKRKREGAVPLLLVAYDNTKSQTST
jgi:hypothetical protein